MASNLLALCLIFQIFKIKLLFAIFSASIVYALIAILFNDDISYFFQVIDSNCFASSTKLYFSSRLRLMFNRDTHKNVYYGNLTNIDVVLKEYPSKTSCVGLEKHDCLLKYKEYVSYSLTDTFIKSLIICPTSKKVDLLLNSTNFGTIAFDQNTENLLLQLLLPTENWPVPAYYETCGNIIVEEFVGPTLSSVKIDSWETRIRLAIQLLEMAELFTFKHPLFSFYFTDISPDNVAIRGNMETVLIDLDHVIIVIKTLSEQDKPTSWDLQHVSHVPQELEGDGSFVFSTDDICQHSISDHNYYAVCEHILRRSTTLGSGLLADPPLAVAKRNPDIKRLLDECSLPRKTKDRILAGQELKILLERILRQSQY